MADIHDRIRDYLKGRPLGAAAEEIARELLRLRGGPPGMAERVVDSTLGDDPRFGKGPDGRWRLAAPGAATPVEAAAFVVVSLTVIRGRGAFAPNRVSRIGAVRVEGSGVAGRLYRAIEENPGETGEGGDAGEESGVPAGQALEDLRAFAKGATMVAEDLRPTLSLLSWEARRAGVGAFSGEGLSLRRLARRLFPDLRLASIGDLARALGAPRYESGRADREAEALGHLLVALLDRCRSRGAVSVTAVLSLQEPDLEDIDYSRYRFDRDFLRNLPERPGAYLMYDRNGVLLYVGKARSLRDRVGSYFARSVKRSEKMEGFLRRLSDIRVQVVGSELEALLLEGRLIRDHRPEFNTQLEVHERAGSPRPGDAIYFLPSAVEGCVEVFMLREDAGLRQVTACQDLTDLREAKGAVEEFYRGGGLPDEAVEEERTDAEIARSWLAVNGEAISRLDLGNPPDLGEALRLLERYIAGCGPTWERVTYR